MHDPCPPSARGVRSRNPALFLLLLFGLAACGGGSGGPGVLPEAPTTLQYAIDPGLYRVGVAIAPNAPTWSGGTPSSFSIAPSLPTGLLLDAATGVLSGTPSAAATSQFYTVTAANGGGQTQTTLSLQVDPALPSAFAFLQPGFAAEVILEPGAPTPAKIAKFALTPARDGRIFYIEVDTGKVRIIDPQSGLLPTPFLSLNVLQGGHMGILGLALSPSFSVDGYVYVLACMPAGEPTLDKGDRIRITRYTDVAGLATNEQVVWDDLPVAPPMGVNNGGELAFDNDGHLLFSIGDVQTPLNAQVDAGTSMAGKVHRIDVSSLPPSIPATNPFAGSSEWCRGLRNTFGLAVQPETGGIFGADNGPAADDELNFLQPGKNFEWGGSMVPGAQAGFTMRTWQTVIVPTALCWHRGVGWGAEYENNLFLASYDDQVIRRFEMSGASFVDIDDETEFARFVLAADDNHPLDLCVAQDGSIYVSTFSGIYRITKQ